jgi:hypothetical protein
LYRVDNLSDEGALHEEAGDSSDEDGNSEVVIPQPERLQVGLITFLKAILELCIINVLTMQNINYSSKSVSLHN